MITGAVLIGGTTAVNYNFGELLPVSISGHVHVNVTGDCDDPANPPLPGVTIELLDATGQVIDHHDDGRQRLLHLRQPCRRAPTACTKCSPRATSTAARTPARPAASRADDLITNIVLISGTDAMDYNFCEIPPASISAATSTSTQQQRLQRRWRSSASRA